MIQPLADDAAADREDQALVIDVRTGSRAALEALIRRHQPWIYNIALRMLWHRQDAEDATQEILIKLMTKLASFEGRSSFRTWLYRIVVNHVLNIKRARAQPLTFASYAQTLDETPDMELPDPSTVPADVQLLEAEARIGCTSGMLLCLDAEQRLIYILGIFGVTDAVGAELLEISRENFRQKLARARRDLHSFMQNQCGLVKKSNPCRCARKTQGFIKAGYIDPANLLFARERVTRVRDVAPDAYETLESLDAEYAALHREHPFQEPPDFVAALRKLVNRPDITSQLELH